MDMQYEQIWLAVKDSDEPIKAVQRITGWSESMSATQYHRLRKMFAPPETTEDLTVVRMNAWTDAEIERIRDESKSNEQLALQLGRTAKAVEVKRYKIGMRIKRKCRADEFEDILSNPDLRNRDVVAMTGLSASAVSIWRRTHMMRTKTHVIADAVQTASETKTENRIPKRLVPTTFRGEVCEEMRFEDGRLGVTAGVHGFWIEWEKLPGFIADLQAAEVMHRES